MGSDVLVNQMEESVTRLEKITSLKMRVISRYMPDIITKRPQ